MPNMKISFLIPAIVFYVVRVAFSNPIQVGTVLFTTTDLVKKCWTESDKSLLKARLIMQDVLPNPDCIDFSKPKSVNILLEYFRSCYEIVTAATCGEMQNIMILALSDALGGYLRGFILPQAKGAFYAGKIRYTDANKIFKLYDDLRLFLRTNGVGWARPPKLNAAKFVLEPLVFTENEETDACKPMYIIEKLVPRKTPKVDERVPEELTKNTNQESLRRQRRSKLPDLNDEDQGFEHLDFANQSSPREDSKGGLRERRKQKDENVSERLSRFLKLKKDLAKHEQKVLKSVLNLFEDKEKKKLTDERKRRNECIDPELEEKECIKKIVIPLPVIDDCVSPHTIAVPFRNRALRSLHTRSSAYIVKRYYSAAIQCLVSKCKSKREVKMFNAQFYNWMSGCVFPHLSDEKWYPGFGSILRVMETIKQFGAETYKKDPTYHDIAFLFPDGFEFEDCNEQTSSGKGTREVADNDYAEPSHNIFYLIALGILGGAWMVTCIVCMICLRNKRAAEYHHQPKEKKKDKKKDNFMNLHFIVKFFKRDEKSKESESFFMETPKEEKKSITPEIDKDKNRRPETKSKKTDSQAQKKNISAKKEKEASQSKNFPFAYQAPYIQHHHLFKNPSTTSPFDSSGKDTKLHNVKTIWRKPSARWGRKSVLKEFEDQSKNGSTTTTITASGIHTEDTKTTESQTKTSTGGTSEQTRSSSSGKKSSCSCSVSCSHTMGTTSGTTSRSQVDENFSSATMETYNMIPTKKKRNPLSSTEETTESESEEESYSSQTEDSEKPQ